MSVERILADKGRNVVTVGPELTLGQVAEILSSKRIGAAVVVDGAGAVLGIVTERDVVRAVGERGASALPTSVTDEMTARVVTCRSDAAIDDIMALMTSGKFRHVPVVEAGRLEGIVSIGDVVKHRLAEIEAEHKAMRDYITTA